MTRIAFVLPSMIGGGAERVTLTLIHECLQRGHVVDLVLMRADGELLQFVPESVTIVDLGARRIRNAFLPLSSYLRNVRPHAVHVAMWPLTVISIAARRLARSKSRMIVSEHIALSEQYRGSCAVMASIRATTAIFYPLADARICVSKGAAHDLARLSGLSTEYLEVVYNPIPQPPDPLPRSPEVERLWGPATHRILTVGSLKAQKNHLLLLKAFANVRDTAAHLMILGEGPLRQELEQHARDLGIADRVIMPGFFVDPWPFYASANLFVLSSDYEGYGNVLVEAMLAGLKIVSTDCRAGPSEILDGGRFGRLAPCGNPEALASAIGASLVETKCPDVRSRAAELSSGPAVERYLSLLT